MKPVDRQQASLISGVHTTTIRQSTRSHISRAIRRFLRQNGYPCENQSLNTVVDLLMQQAQVLSQDWNIA